MTGGTTATGDLGYRVPYRHVERADGDRALAVTILGFSFVIIAAPDTVQVGRIGARRPSNLPRLGFQRAGAKRSQISPPQPVAPVGETVADAFSVAKRVGRLPPPDWWSFW
jgi:hypothetical protein